MWATNFTFGNVRSQIHSHIRYLAEPKGEKSHPWGEKKNTTPKILNHSYKLFSSNTQHMNVCIYIPNSICQESQYK